MVSFRAVRARSGQSLALFAIGVLAVAGCVVAVGFSRATNVSVGSAAALLLLGIVALAAQGAVSVRARRFEIALAQLRGRHGLGLLRTAVTEPLVILLAAAATGVVLGGVLARVVVSRWAGDGTTFQMSRYEWVTAAVVLLAGALVVATVSWRTTCLPLSAKLDSLHRPRHASAAALLFSLLVLIGAGVSVYQARQLGVRRADWVSFLSPALLGLAAGQIAVWTVALVSRLAMGSTRLNRRLGWFLTLRRLTRRADSVATIRLAVAAVVVAGIAVSAWAGSQTWRDQTARMQTGGPVAFAVAAGGLRAYIASHEADPSGEWLMAISASPDPFGGSRRAVFVDTPRWDRVVGSHFEGTPVASVGSEIDALSPAETVQTAQGDTFSVTLSAESVDRAWPTRKVQRIEGRLTSYGFAPLQFTVRYVTDEGDNYTLQVPDDPGTRPPPVTPGYVGHTAAAPGCARGCAVQSVSVQGVSRNGQSFRVTEMTFAGMALLPAGTSGLSLSETSRALRAVASRGGLDLSVTDAYSSHLLLEWERDVLPAALVAPGVRLERSRGVPQVYGPDGDARPIQVTGQAAALPLLGRAGILLDLGTALRGAGGQISGAQARVVARADTPAQVLDDLRGTGAVGRQTTVEQAVADIQRGPRARGSTLYALIAVFGLLIAAVSLVSSTAEQRRERRSEAASLRVVGVGVGDVAGSHRAEAAVLGTAVIVVAGVAVWIGCRALLDVLPLVVPGEFGLLLDATPRLGLVAGLAFGAGLFVALVVFLSFRFVARSSPPSMLSDEAR